MTEKLSERVEAHNGGDGWPLRVDIAEALGWTSKPVGGVIAWYAPEEPDVMKAGPPKWLTSLDAAMSLVPEGCTWQLSVGRVSLAQVTDCTGGPTVPPPDFDATAATPAIALCAAALRLRGL